MSICIKGQKFLGTDLELIEFIQKDLDSFFSKVATEFFLKKETAIKIGEMMKHHLNKELFDFKKLGEILNSNEINLLDQKKIIIENDSIKKVARRISLLKKAKEESKDYLEILKLLKEYYSLKEYTTLLDIDFLSTKSSIIIFFHENTYYTSLQIDNENLFIDFIFKNKKFIDYSFDFEDTSKSKIKEDELSELIEKEKVWKSIYSNLESKDNKNKQAATTYIFDFFKDEVVQKIKNNKNYKELYSLVKNNYN